MSRHAKVKQAIKLFSQVLDSIREKVTDNEKSQIVKIDLQRILAWFKTDNFQHNLDLLSTARKQF